jgi:hypothetical protein
MKTPVTDALVAEYTRQLRSGGPVGAVFPQPLSDCDFNDAQKSLIKEARKTRKQLVKKSQPHPAPPPQAQPKPLALKPAAAPSSKPKPVALKPTASLRTPDRKTHSLTALEQLLFPPAPQPKTPKSAAPPPPKPKATAARPTAPAHALAPKPQSSTKLQRILYLQQGKCFFCGEKLAAAEANIEHLNPLSKGGTRTEDNEVVCHKSLNDTFGNMPLKQKFEFVLKAAGSFRCPKP